MRKRGISESNENNNFLGNEVNDEVFLVSRTRFRCKTEWTELNRYCRKLKIKLQWIDKAVVIFDNNSPCHAKNLNKALFEYTQLQLKAHSATLRLQGAFLQIQNVDEKISPTIHYNWKLNDQLLIFYVKARLNILPTIFTLFIWNCENNPRCPFRNHATESMAHLLNGYQREFGNFYSRRHNRIADYLHEQFKTIDRRYKTYNNKYIDTIVAQHRERLVLCNNRKPHIIPIDPVARNIETIEVTICYDLYIQLPGNGKIEKHRPLVNVLIQLGYKVKLHVLCFGSLGNITKECGSIV